MIILVFHDQQCSSRILYSCSACLGQAGALVLPEEPVSGLQSGELVGDEAVLGLAQQCCAVGLLQQEHCRIQVVDLVSVEHTQSLHDLRAEHLVGRRGSVSSYMGHD